MSSYTDEELSLAPRPLPRASAGRPPLAASDSPERRHARAVLNTLHLADDAARRGQYEDALSWLNTLLAIGDSLPEHYVRKQALWQAALMRQPPSAGQHPC